MTRINEFAMFLVAVFFVLAISGCVRETFLVSIPLEIPQGLNGKIDQNLFSGQLTDFQFSIEIHNFYPLGMRLTFDVGDNDFVINPMLINIVTNSGDHLIPATFLGPSQPWVSPRAFLRGCGPRRYSLGTAASKIDLSADETLMGNPVKGVFKTPHDLVPFSGNACFMFWYPYEPSTDDVFHVSIEGVSKSGVRVQIPDVRFGSGKVTKTMVIP